MSAGWVIDSSVGIAWIHPARATHDTKRLLDQVEAGATVVVPSIWFAEIANGLLILQRRKKLTAAERSIALDTLSALNLTVDDESGGRVFGRVSELAEDFDLTVYDALYLELALRRKLILATRDTDLAKAAKRAGVELH